MGAIYFEILRRIERNHYDVFSRRVRVPRPQRAAIALRVWIKALAHRALPGALDRTNAPSGSGTPDS